MMSPLTQAQLELTLSNIFGWADFSCVNMPKLQSYFCREPVAGLTFTQPSMAKQSFKEEADINNIVNQYLKTGVLPEGQRQPLFGDFSTGNDFQEAMLAIQEAQEDFAALPSAIRERFKNNPAEILAFMSDPENEAEARELGLIPQKEQPAPVETPVETPPSDD